MTVSPNQIIIIIIIIVIRCDIETSYVLLGTPGENTQWTQCREELYTVEFTRKKAMEEYKNI